MNEYRENLARRRRAPRSLVALVSVCLLGTVPAVAQPGRIVATDPGTATAAAALRIDAGKVRLTLDEAIEIALQRNLGLVVQRYSRAQAGLGIQQAMGAYDLGLRGSLARGHNESATSSSLDGAEVRKQDTE